MIAISREPVEQTTYLSRLQKLLPDSPWPLGFGFWAIWTSLIVRQNAIDHAQINTHVLFYCASGLIFLVVALYYWFRKDSPNTLPRLPFFIVALTCMLLSSCFLTLKVFGGSALFAVLGSLGGALGSCMTLLAWGAYLSRLPLMQSFFSIFGSFAIQFLLIPNFFLFPPLGSSVILLVLAIGSIACLFVSIRSTKPESSQQGLPAKEDPESGSRRGARSHEFPTIYYDKSTLPEFWKLLVVVIIYSFLLTLRNTISFESGTSIVYVLHAAALIATIFLFWSMTLHGSSMLFERRLQLLLLLFAIGFFLLPFSTGWVFESIGVLFFIATGLIYMIFVLAMIDIAHHSSVHPFVIIGAWGACYGLPRVLYFAIQALRTYYGDTDVSAFAVSLISMLCIVIIVAFLLGNRPAGLRPIFFSLIHPGNFPEDTTNINEKCLELSAEYGLTTRELEILTLVCNGRSRRYIAEQLYVSENTVKAHLKKIYAKMNIHSKYDLEKILWDEE